MKASFETGDRVSFPATIYAVSIVYVSEDGKTNRAAAWLSVVSGRTPLTNDEILARARKDKDADGWRMVCWEAVVSWIGPPE